MKQTPKAITDHPRAEGALVYRRDPRNRRAPLAVDAKGNLDFSSGTGQFWLADRCRSMQQQKYVAYFINVYSNTCFYSDSRSPLAHGWWHGIISALLFVGEHRSATRGVRASRARASGPRRGASLNLIVLDRTKYFSFT